MSAPHRVRRRVGLPVTSGTDRNVLLSYTGPVRPQACLTLLVMLLGAGTAPAEPAPHPWGIEKFLTRYGMWEGCKKGARVRPLHRTAQESMP